MKKVPLNPPKTFTHFATLLQNNWGCRAAALLLRGLERSFTKDLSKQTEIITDSKGRIFRASKPYEGRVHDFEIRKTECPLPAVPILRETKGNFLKKVPLLCFFVWFFTFRRHALKQCRLFIELMRGSWALMRRRIVNTCLQLLFLINYNTFSNLMYVHRKPTICR